MTLELVLLAACIVVSAFASGSETALVSASRIRLQHLAADQGHAAARALALLDRRDRILAVTLVVTNVFNIAGGAIATEAFARRLGLLGAIVATVLMTSVLLVLSEIVPKAYFRHHADRMLVGTAGVWRLLSWVLIPITLLTHLFSTLLFQLLGKRPRSFFTTREEIKLVLAESVEQGGLLEHEHEMLESSGVTRESRSIGTVWTGSWGSSTSSTSSTIRTGRCSSGATSGRPGSCPTRSSSISSFSRCSGSGRVS
jgi:Mg2+/Co2+ transporter CorB